MTEELIDILMQFKTDEKSASERFSIFIDNLIENPRQISDDFHNLSSPIHWSMSAGHLYFFNSVTPLFHVFAYRSDINRQWYVIHKKVGTLKTYEFDTEAAAKIFSQNLYSVIVLKKLFDQKGGLLNPKFFIASLTDKTNGSLSL